MGHDWKKIVVYGEDKCWTSCAIIDHKNCWSLRGNKECNFPHLSKANPYYQEWTSSIHPYGLFVDVKVFTTSWQKAIKFNKPYIDRIVIVAKPRVDKVQVVLKPHTKDVLFVFIESFWNQLLHIIVRF